MVTQVTEAAAPEPGSQRPVLLRAEGSAQVQATMAATPKATFYPQEPYYIPGYSGFYPQIRYKVGKTYGRMSYDSLTDPEVQKSPCPVLAPLTRPKFIEDYSYQIPPGQRMVDLYQPYVPGYTEAGCFPFPGRETRPLPVKSTPLAKPQICRDDNAMQLFEQRKYTPCHPGIRLSCGPGWRQFASTVGSNLVSLQGDQKSMCHPDVALVCGREEKRGPCNAGISLLCGQGWREVPCLPGHDQPTRIEAMPLPLPTQTVDVKRFGRTPQMDLPNLIQRKAISGYTGFIPRFTWVMGVNYLKGVKDAMNDFDKNQAMLRSPVYTFGKRLPSTYWPDTEIYNSRGLVPFYTGFVPTIRDNYALTFGNSTRKAYFDELKRRQFAG